MVLVQNAGVFLGSVNLDEWRYELPFSLRIGVFQSQKSWRLVDVSIYVGMEQTFLKNKIKYTWFIE